MEIFDKALGVHPYSLQVRLDRAEIITSNLANVDTPGYLARDIDYQNVMQSVSAKLETSFHSDAMSGGREQVKYRVPYQSSPDGNTVDLNVEQAKFASNSMDFQTAITFLNMKIEGLHKAIRGE